MNFGQYGSAAVAGFKSILNAIAQWSDNPPVESVPRSVVRLEDTTNHLAVAAHPDTIQALSEELAPLAE